MINFSYALFDGGNDNNWDNGAKLQKKFIFVLLMKKTWKLSFFDSSSLYMIIKGAWIYEGTLDLDRMKSALKSLAKEYPILSGRYCAGDGSLVWEDSTEPELLLDSIDLRDYTIPQLSGNARLTWSLVKKYDLKGFRNGKAQPFSATLGYLKDGCILFVQCAHATMDSNTFYKLIRQWSELYKGTGISTLTVDQSLVPSGESLSKEETLRLSRQKGWISMNFKKLSKMFIGLVRNILIKRTVVTELSQEEISRLCTETGTGMNAALSAFTLKKIAERVPKKKRFRMLFTTDLRGRIDGVDESFFGNMSQPVAIEGEVSASQDLASISSFISDALQAALNAETLCENIRLYLCSIHYGLQYIPFDASDINCPGNGTVIINNFLKFRASEIEWGDGLPVYTFPNELPDMVKFWQAVSGGPVQIIFGGYAARLMK